MEYILFIALIGVIGVVLVQSYNITLGFTGIFHLGHIGFYAIGAYTAAILSTRLGTPFLVTLPASFIIAGAAGFLIGIPAIRLKSHYLALATLGFGEIIRLIALNWVSFTEGPMGINKIPPPNFFGVEFMSTGSKLIIYIIIAAIINFIIYKIVHSPYGKILETIREDEIAAEAIGKNTTHYKLQALAISAGFAGIAGAMYAHGLHFIDPSLFQIQDMVLILTMIITGGVGNFWGAILGPFIIYAIFEPLRFIGTNAEILGVELNIGALRMLIYALGFVALIIFRPQGIIGRLKKVGSKSNS